MKKRELIFRFQNPNTAEITAEFFLQTIIKANEKRMDELFLHTTENRKGETDEKRRCVLPCIHG